MSKWACRSCDWDGTDEQLLRAPSPFDALDTLIGCPACKAVDDLDELCDEPGCDQVATHGFPVPGGYRWTCDRHDI